MFSKILSGKAELDNTVIAVTQLVKELKIEIAASEIRKKLKWSPSYPGISSIQSFLKQWNAYTIVLDVNKENIHKLPPVFLCHIPAEKDSFKIVTKHDETSVQWLTNNDENITLPINEFLEKWSGIVLIAEKRENSGMPDYKSVRRMEWWEKYAIQAVLLVLAFAAFAHALIGANAGISVLVTTILLQLFNITGILICLTLLRYLIDDTDDAVKQICRIGKSSKDCTKIITATDSNFFGFSWAEIGLAWFFGAGLCMATTGTNIVAGLFSIVAILFIPYSVYYQVRVAKQYCIICLYILCIIGIQAGLYLYLFTTLFSAISLNSIFYDLPAALCCILIPAICWLTLKRFIFNRKALLLAEQGYFRLKHNQKNYDLLQTNAASIDTSKGSPVSFNSDNNNAFEITIVSSLSCSPCGEAHKLIEKVIKNNPNISFKMYILPVADPAYNTIAPLKILLTILEKEGIGAFLKALNYWYHIANMDYLKFLKEYPERNSSPAIDDKIDEMGNWISVYNIKTTPAYFINGKEMPETYGIEDILAMVSNF